MFNSAIILKRHLEFFELLENHVVRHVVKQAITRRQDDITELHVERGVVSGFGTAAWMREVGGNSKISDR